MAKHDIVLLNVTSSNFETNINDNVARIKGDSDKLFSLQQSGSVDSLISVDSNNPSITFNARITSSGHISSSFNSTASFGRVNVTRLVGDASQMTDTNEVGHVSSSKQLASRISGAFTAGFTLEGENRLISGSRTSTGSFTRVFSNIYVGDASDMHSVNEQGHFSGSAQLASRISGSFTSGFEFTGKISGSATSTGSFGRVNFSGQIAGNAAAVTIDQSGFFSGSAQLADSISGSFIRGFNLESGASISGSVTSTGSFTETTASNFSGDASQVTGVGNALPANVLSGSGGIAAQISGAFTSGFVLQSKTTAISGSATSTGSFGTMVIGSTFGVNSSISDTSGLTGFSCAGLISSSAQLATSISGSFTSGMSLENSLISGSRLSTGSFSLVSDVESISGDASQVTGLTIPAGVLSGSAQISSKISGSFNKGFNFDGSISGSITSTGSFSRLNLNSLKVNNLNASTSSLTGYDTNHVSSSAQIASQISGAFTSGFSYDGTISGSSASLLKIQSLNLGGTSNFTHTDLRKNWDGSFVQTATFGNSLGARISGSFIRGFSYQGTISGSATSTGSFNQIKSQELFVKEMVGKRKPISGSMNHTNYISASYKSNTHGRLTIPTFGRGHQVNTQQFTATGSMNNQEYRARAGQLFVDNFGRLNMTVQTGSMVAVAGTWTEGPDNPNTSRGVQSVGFSYAAMEVAGLSAGTGSAQYDDIAWSVTADSTHKRDGGVLNKSIGTVDAAMFIGHTGGQGGFASPGNTGVPNFNDFFEIWDGVSFSRCGSGAGRISGYSWRRGAAAKGGSSNSHLVFGGDYGWAGYTRTSCWNGVNWEAASYNLNNDRCDGAGFGGVSDAVYAGGNSPLDTCTEEWNGATWATANATPSPAAAGGIGHSQNAGLVAGPSTTVQEYDGTSWSAGTSTLSSTGEHSSAGSSASGLVLQGLGGAHRFQKWTGGFITGSADTYNNFSQNPTGRYLLTKKLQANYSPGTSGGVTSGSSDGYGGGY